RVGQTTILGWADSRGTIRLSMWPMWRGPIDDPSRVSTMSRDICQPCRETTSGASGTPDDGLHLHDRIEQRLGFLRREGTRLELGLDLVAERIKLVARGRGVP